MPISHAADCGDAPTRTVSRRVYASHVSNASASNVLAEVCSRCGEADLSTVTMRAAMVQRRFVDPETGTPFTLACYSSTAPVDALRIVDAALDDDTAPADVRALAKRRAAIMEAREAAALDDEADGVHRTAWGPVTTSGDRRRERNASGVDWMSV